MEQIKVERRRHPLLVVIGRHHDHRRLDHIEANEEGSAAAQELAGGLQEGHGLVGPEIADRRAGEEPRARPAGGGVRQVKGGGEVVHHRSHFEPGIIPPDGLGRRVEGVRADVDGHIDAELRRGVQQDAGLGAGAGAELHQGRVVGDHRRHLRGLLAHQRRLGAGGIVFRQLGDFLEQPRALGVIEVLGLQRLARP